MWDRMTERAQKVIRLAQEEALALNHQAVGTEHLLLGLIKEGQGVAARSLQNLQINIEQVREQVIQVIGKGETKPEGQPGLTPRAKKVLELALDESRRQGVNYIGTEHILLGLIREGEGIAARVLANMGVTATDIRKQVELLGDPPLGAPSFSLGDLSVSWAAGRGFRCTSSQVKKGGEYPTLDSFGRDLTSIARKAI